MPAKTAPEPAQSNSNPARSTGTWLDLITGHPSLDAIVKRLGAHSPAYARTHGGSGSSAMAIAALLSRHAPGPLLLVTAHLDDADQAGDELAALGFSAEVLPALEVLPGETGVDPDLLGRRLDLARCLIDDQAPDIIVASIHALMQTVPQKGRIDNACLHLTTGTRIGQGHLLDWLANAGYHRVPSVDEPGQFSVRGGLVDVYPVGRVDETLPVRLDFFGDEIETITQIAPDTLASDRRIDAVRIIGASIDDILTSDDVTAFTSFLPDDTWVILAELMEITEQARGYYERATSGGAVLGPPTVLKALAEFPLLQIDQHPPGATDPDATFDLPFEPIPRLADEAGQAIGELLEMIDQGTRVAVLCLSDAEHERFAQLVAQTHPDHTALIESHVAYLHRGFLWRPQTGPPVALVPYHELLHRYHRRRSAQRLKAGRTLDAFIEMAPGDFVVHRDHGIARFVGLTHLAEDARISSQASRRADGDLPAEYLTLEFAGRATLHVPLTKITLVQKYVGGHDGKPPLSHMGGKRWSGQKQQVKQAVKDLAAQMLRIQAAREHVPGIRYPADTRWQTQFESEFPFDETPDQLAAISEIKKDMADHRPMDRLLCGDVGFGKTELAVRAAFKAIEYGRQVAVLVPTTVLAEQHYHTFKQRMADYPFRVEVVSRFRHGKTIRTILSDLAKGRVDVVIGTHRLLSKDVHFADLGLVVVDEEQRFGVEHKQRLLQFRLTADVLTLSATPIPRTLHMAMLGLRDISSLTTAPLDRRAVVTEVIPYNEKRIAHAIQRELSRQGQIFFVHNRVHNIQRIAQDVQRLAPNARILVGHGQMSDRDLENVMIRFIRHEADILVSTTIIESGIDIPTANTMFINEATGFGLADLHQLRGRVGRFKHRAYCYLLLPRDKAVTSTAARRLRAIEEFSMLGAGFRIAVRDLEMRGAGNLLGPEQSGHIAAVGYDMYCHLLESSVHELRNEQQVQPVDTEVEIGITGGVPKGYIPSDLRRMEAYRRIGQARTLDELQNVQRELNDAYGSPPSPTTRLIELTRVRIAAAHLDVRALTRHEQDLIFETPQPDRLADLLDGIPGSVRKVAPRTAASLATVYYRPDKRLQDDPASLLTVLRHRLTDALNSSGSPAASSPPRPAP